jgi:hypothetical protein
MALDRIQVSEHFYWSESTGEFLKNGEFLKSNVLRASDSSYDAKVAVFEDRQFHWFLGVAQRMTAKGASPDDYVALSIAVAYIEGIEQYRHGERTPGGKSTEWFKASAKRIFPGATASIDRLWIDVRNGLFHSGFTIGRTYLDYTLNLPLKSFKGGLLKINPHRFVDCTVDDFEKYVHELRENPTGELGRQFQKLWDERWRKW